MENREEFLKKLQELVAVAKRQDNCMSIEEVKEYFAKEHLTEEQLELVFDYLLAQKVVVKGYIKITEPEATPELTYTEDEKAYLEEYLEDLKAFRKEEDGERQVLYRKKLEGNTAAKNRLTEIYLGEVVAIAKEMYHPDIFLGDLIQEGNVGLILGLEMFDDEKQAHDVIVGQIRQNIQMLIEEHTELSNRDKKMVEKVSMLDEAIKTLTEELGRKVTIDELAIHLGMTEEEIDDILRLTGEETEEEKSYLIQCKMRACYYFLVEMLLKNHWMNNILFA